MKRYIPIVAIGIALFTTLRVCGQPPQHASRNTLLTDDERAFAALYDQYVRQFKPLSIAAARAWWDASISGTDEAFQVRQAAEEKLIELHGNREVFAKIKSLRDGGNVHDPMRARELKLMYLAFLPGQADPAVQKRIVELEAKVDQAFNTHRGVIDGKPKTENEIREILAKTNDSVAAEKAWKAYMQVGEAVDAHLRELVELRNRAARQLGYKNFFAMRLELQEIDEDELFKLFDELDTLTAAPFDKIKRDIDARMAKRFGISVGDLRPWHYGDLFFQEAPDVQEVSLDDVLKGRDLVKIASAYYASLKMPVDDIVRRSDLYEKEGKSPHAFCSDIDRAGDVRVLCNVKPTAYWMDTVVHELGHAVYDSAIDRNLPFTLREASHSITTEGIAQMFGSMTKSQEWLSRALGLDDVEAKRFVSSARETLRTEKIIFSRWTQVMVRFEHGMYTDPAQNLGKLWWDLKERYQQLHSPSDTNRPDYAAKMHIVGAPVYYHSYLMGDLFASQVRHYIATKVLEVSNVNGTCFYGRPEAGDYLRKNIFAPGKLYPWNELTKRATGEPLTAKYFAQQYIK